MQNGAYTLAFFAAVGGLILLMISGQDGFETALGTVLLLLAPLLAGVGKVIDVLSYVRDGATDRDE